MERYIKRTRDLMEKIELNIIGKWLFYGVIIGAVSALGAYVFVYLLTLSTEG